MKGQKNKCHLWIFRFLFISLKEESFLEFSAITLGVCSHKGESESELQNLPLITQLSLTVESFSGFMPVYLTDPNTSSYLYNLKKSLIFSSLAMHKQKAEKRVTPLLW